LIKNARTPSAGLILQHAASAALAVAIVAGTHSIKVILYH
jgi:hypothetical protein